MKVQPTPEQWALLTRVEKANFLVADFLNRNRTSKRIMNAAGATIGMGWVEGAACHLNVDHGFEHFKEIDPSRGVLLVANHRSFFDLYAVTGRLYRLYGRHHRIYFPVRSTFFYDHPLGQLVNVPVAMGTMYPPIMRDRNRKEWNRFSRELMTELLQDPRNMIGFHPEGTRNKDPDPYRLLPGKPGCGELIYKARPNVVPVFLQGFPRYAWHSVLLNYDILDPGRIWTHMVMGPPIQFKEEYELPDGLSTYHVIVDKVMSAIQGLSEQEREIRKQWSSK